MAGEMLFQAESREHVFVGDGPCYYCGVFKQAAKHRYCSLERPGEQ